MSLRDAFALGWMMGSAFNFLHCKGRNGMDFSEALQRFDKANEKKGIPKGFIDPVFGFTELKEPKGDAPS